MGTTRFGIIGTGQIAAKFAEGLTLLPTAELTAVASRNRTRADEFGKRHRSKTTFGGYRELAESPDIDVVYIATPHSQHCPNTLMCLETDKHVLCEKPFALNHSQAAKMVAAARERSLFLQEAMWTRFLPIHVKLRELLAESAVGTVEIVQADFGFQADSNPSGRLHNPALGGGALLDVGVYPIALASMVFGATQPVHIASSAAMGQTEVDENAGFVLRYRGGKMLIGSASIRVNTPQSAQIIGTRGQIHIHAPWWCPGEMSLKTDRGRTTAFKLPFEGNGYQCEAAHVIDCLNSGRQESDVMPLDESLAIMRIMDEIRTQWDLRYPGE